MDTNNDNAVFEKTTLDVTKKQIAKELKKHREQEGLTQTQLAKEIGISLRYVQWIEAGDKFNEKTINKIANFFGLSLTIEYDLKKK